MKSIRYSGTCFSSLNGIRMSRFFSLRPFCSGVSTLLSSNTCASWIFLSKRALISFYFSLKYFWCLVSSETILTLKPLPNFLLRLSGVSHWDSSPSLMMQILFPMKSASSICWVEMSMHRSFCCAIFLINNHIFSLDLRSRLEVGSSRIINLASPIKAMAIDSFLFAPGEINLTFLWISVSTSTSLALSAITWAT